APALFGPIMNTTGSLLATYWSQHPPKEVLLNEETRVKSVSSSDI
ncbi:MAG: bile acid:sodium symporter family protein, partial [Chitinophagaceae bacterium]